MFKVNNRDSGTTSVTYFTPFSRVSSVDFEHVNDSSQSSKYASA